MTNASDILILGGGSAGMTAAIYGARAGLTVTLLDTNICGGLVNSTFMVENFPSYKAIHGMELMELMRDQVAELGVRIEEVCALESVVLDGTTKRVSTDLGVFEAPAVIIATGRRPIPLVVEGAEDCAQVHHCAICDGSPYKGKRVLVVGGGNSGFDEALYLMNLGVKELLLVEQMPRFFAAQKAQDALLARPGTSARHSRKVAGLHLEQGMLRAVTLMVMDREKESSVFETVDVDGIFVFMGQLPNTAMFSHLLPLNAQGYIQTDELMETGLPGVFAAGDVRVKTYRQITTAMADGTIAALRAERYLRS